MMSSDSKPPSNDQETFVPANPVPASTLRPGPGFSANIEIDGRYTLLEKIGAGGMGEVWAAQQSEPVKRKVALKLIRAGMDSQSVIHRFEQERQALALMDHPNIAKVLDAGVTSWGHPYFVMELVNGPSLTAFCDATRLLPRERLELFIPICHAVQHAHQKGIVHRDLKPANILVTLVDGKPVPKVIDFGVAKATGGKLTDQTLSTGFGAIVGTLEYMSPEQAGATGDDVDTRADIYSLGVVLYELLTGLRPFDGERLRRAAISEMIRIIREDDPARPSTRLSSDASLPSMAALRQTEPRKLMADLRGELDWVVMKCMEKNRDRRYETANGLARDIQRYLAREPVEARPPSASYRFRKLLVRNKGLVTASVVVLLTLIGGTIGTTWGMIAAGKQAERARLAADAADDARLRETEQRKIAEQATGQALTALESFTDDLMGKLLGGREQLKETEIAILTNAQRQWEVFADSRGTSPEARLIQAKGAARLGSIQRKLGLHKESEANERKALRLRESLAADFPDNAAYRFELAVSHQVLGGSLRSSGQREEAGQNLARAKELFAALAAKFPDEPDYRDWLAASCLSAGNVERDFGNWSEAASQYTQALEIAEALSAQAPDNDGYRKDVAGCHWSLAFLNKRQEQYAAAKGHYARAIEIYDSLVAKTPASIDYRQSVASLRRELGIVLSDDGDDAAGIAQMALALPTQESLVAEFPSVPIHRLNLARSHCDWGHMLESSATSTEAEAHFAKAVELFERLTVEHPTMLPYKSELAVTWRYIGDQRSRGEKPELSLDAYNKAIDMLTTVYAQDRKVANVKKALLNSLEHRADTLDELGRHTEALPDRDRVLELCPPEMKAIHRSQRADSLLRSGDVAAALTELDELRLIENANPRHWFRFACLYAHAGIQDAEKREQHFQQAIELLQKSVTLGFDDLPRIQASTDLAPLHERDDFRQIVQSLNTSPEKPL